jgi:AcrR family transcriptional regulator
MSENETRQHILDIAIQLIAQFGFANMSMNDIVRESGVSKGGVYWHFKNKDELILAVFDYFLDMQLQVLNMLLQSEEKAATKLENLFRLATQEAEANMPQPLEFYAVAARNDALKERMAGYFEAYHQRMVDLVQQGIEVGEFETSDPETVAINIISLLEGIFLVATSVPRKWDLQAQVSNAVDLILRGLSKRL